MPPFNMVDREEYHHITNPGSSAGSRGHYEVIVPIDEEDEELCCSEPGPILDDHLLNQSNDIMSTNAGGPDSAPSKNSDFSFSTSSTADQPPDATGITRAKESTDHQSAAPSPTLCNTAPLSSVSTPIKPATKSSIKTFYKKRRKSQAMPPASSERPDDINASPLSSDPPTKLIENFLQRQAASGNLCLDMDMDMMEKLPQVLADDGSLNNNIASIYEVNPSTKISSVDQEAPGTSKRQCSSTKTITDADTPATAPKTASRHAISFKPANVKEAPHDDGKPLATSAETGAFSRDGQFNPATQDGTKSADIVADQRNAGVLNDSDADDAYNSSEDDGEAFNRQKSVLSSLARLQTRSRLADPPPNLMQQNGPSNYRSAQLRSGPMRSGLIKNSGIIGKPDADEEDDPLKDVDMPEGFRKQRWSLFRVFEWVLFFLIMAGLICSLTVPALKQRPLWTMALWKWVLLVFLIFSGRLVSGWIIRILVVILERNFLLRKRVLYFVYGLRKGVQNFLWFAFTVLAWRLVFDPKLEKTTNSKVPSLVTKILNCFLIGAALWLVKIFCVKVLASSFHVSTYFERIRESLFGQWVIETLSGPPLVEMEEEANLIDEIDGLRKAGARIPEEMVPEKRLGADVYQYHGGHQYDKPAVNQNGLKNKGYIHMPTMNRAGMGKSGVIGLERSGMLGVGRSGLIGANGKSGMIGGGVGKSGMIGRSGMLRLKSQHNFNMERMCVPEEAISIDHLHRLNEKNISAWNMKRMMNFVRYRGVCTLAQVIDQSAANQGNFDESQDVEIESEWQARSVARRIFKNVAKPRSRYIVKDDLLRFMREVEVEKAMALFEGATETGKITKSALKEFAAHVVRERRALSLSLNDTKTAVKKLHRLVDVVVGVAIAIISMLVLGIATTHLLLLVSSQLVLVVFIFGNTCKTVFEAIVFLFVMHPFDVGDRCVVDGNQVVVEEMNILSTVFMRNDGEKLWYPNSLLATKFIFNYHCTPDMGDSFQFCIDSSTPADKINTLKERIAKYIAMKASYWSRDFNLLVKEIENHNKMNLELLVNHTINYNAPGTERQVRRSELILEVQKMLQELDFSYHLPLQEVCLTKYDAPSDHIRHRHLAARVEPLVE
ncbi:hypothetical protein GOP47_0019081 [Adiantum capillus-veneris]|uniref:Mechanosensitive ion channel MscS domain-containing protein n=1 Tax=Adiantum capillus-veneris TaxID=13818 RepID=A0A9D4ZA71_ADICA|nr:hypothetical protein GOP47_0019081 [Adiantum capillus-veneris]